MVCFACKLFSSKARKLTTEGHSDWSNINSSLRGHECSPDHTQSLLQLRELDIHLKKNLTIDHQELTLLEAEEERWCNVLKHLISITLSLASRNLSFRGSSQVLHVQDNGNFLKEVELLAQFDPMNHLTKIKDESSCMHYLGQQTQNELMQIIST